MSLPRKLKNFVLFNSGNAYVSEVPEVKPPKLTRKTDDYRAGGMGGSIKTDQGLEPLEMEWKVAGYVRDLLRQWGAVKHDAVQLRFVGALQADDSDRISSLEIVVRGRHTELDFGTAKAGDNTEITVKSALSYYRLSIDGEVLIEIDVVNMIEVIGGVDRMAEIRSAIGL